MLDKFKNSSTLRLFASWGLHAVFVLIVVYFIWPILVLYWNQKPAVGIDLFLSVNWVTYVHNHFSLPFSMWNYTWYSGTPFIQSYPMLHYFLMQPILHWFSAVQTVQIYVLGSYVLLIVFSYLLFYSVSKSRGLSAVLAVATAYSFNLWSAIYWAGAIPYSATMFMLPLSLYLTVRTYETMNKKYVYSAALLCGLFVLGHPQSFIGYTVPITTILILFFGSEQVKVFKWEKFSIVLFFAIIMFFVGFPQAGIGSEVLAQFFAFLESIFVHGAQQIGQSYISSSAKETAGTPIARMFDIYRRTNMLFFWALKIGAVAAVLTTILAFVTRRRISHHSKLLFPAILMIIYFVAFIYAFAIGINPFSGGWFRVFWPSMIVFGFAISVLWRITADNLGILIGGWEKRHGVIKWYGWIMGTIWGLVVLVVGMPFLQSTYRAFQIETLSYVSESSQFPTTLALNLKKGDWPEKLPKLVPDWLNPNDLSYRIYDIDATFNIWWNSVFKMPLARGYLDASPKVPSKENYAGWQYLQNVVFSKNEAVAKWGYSEDQARAMSAFLIDWAGIKYFEGAPVYGRNYSSFPSTYIMNNKDLINKIDSVYTLRPAKYFQIEGRGWDIPDYKQELKYYRVSDSATSPIYSASVAPTILVIGDSVGQDTMMRDLGLLNFNSRRAIIVQWNKPIDSLSQKELDKFNLVVAYRYKYNNYAKSFQKLENYVSNGGNLFIDTGTEQKESVNQHLLSVFPFEQSNRRDLGKDWDFKIEDNQITNGISFDKFSEPVFDGAGWSFSYPETSLKEGAKVLISNHKKPVLVSYGLGKGKIIWSGMNFAGHVQRFKNPEEVALFKNILFYFADFSKDKSVDVSFERPSSEKVIIKGSKAKAVLFKESAYSGWEAKVRGRGFDEGVQVYEAGPMVPGYMFVFLPEKAKNGDFEVTFKYKGELINQFSYTVSFVSILIVLDVLFLKRVFSIRVGRVLKHGHRRVSRWWEKDEEI